MYITLVNKELNASLNLFIGENIMTNVSTIIRDYPNLSFNDAGQASGVASIIISLIEAKKTDGSDALEVSSLINLRNRFLDFNMTTEDFKKKLGYLTPEVNEAITASGRHLFTTIMDYVKSTNHPYKNLDEKLARINYIALCVFAAHLGVIKFDNISVEFDTPELRRPYQEFYDAINNPELTAEQAVEIYTTHCGGEMLDQYLATISR